MKRAPALIPLLLLAACATRSPGDPERGPILAATGQPLADGGTPACPSDAGTCVPVSSSAELAGACPQSRWIALPSQPVQGCPGVQGGVGGHWNASRLFDSPDNGALPPGLASFCAYDWVPTQGNAPPDVPALLSAFTQYPGTRLDPDCQVMTPLGSSAAVDAGWQTLHADFHQQTAWLPNLPIDPMRPPMEIRVAVVDSSPHQYSDGEAGGGRLTHGHVVGRVIRELGCPAGDLVTSSACIAQVSNHLALAHVTPQVADPVDGGYFGLMSETARAIHGAVNDWDTHNRTAGSGDQSPPQPRLVINLSIGWDARYGGDYASVGDLPAPARAVHDAITHAVCRGALVIAAAGNDPGGPDPVNGPMYPAGWETKAAPTPTLCAGFEGPDYVSTGTYALFPPADASVYQPMVFAAGGVRGDDRPLALSRPGGRPRLVAPGFHALAATAGADGGTKPTDVLTGTSISAAVASGTAATLWGYRPQLSGPEVMALLRQGSVDLGVPADFCVGGLTCPYPTTDARRTVRRAALCQALAAACPGGAIERCPVSPPPCAPRPAYSGGVAHLTPTELSFLESRITRTFDPTDGGTTPYLALSPVGVCRHAELDNTAAVYPETVCPFRQFYSTPLRPWTKPQPAANPCPACELHYVAFMLGDGSTGYEGVIYGSIDTDYSSVLLKEPSLLLTGKTGRYEVKLTGTGPLTGGDEVKITGIPIDPASLPLESATLNFRSDEMSLTLSTTSELAIVPP